VITDEQMIGLCAAFLGGLFSVILLWRNERFRAEERAAAEPRQETGGS
jgi:hypothetical protein